MKPPPRRAFSVRAPRSTFANRGKEWERLVEDQHAAYARQRRASWVRNEPHRGRQWEDAPAIEEMLRRGRGAPDYTVRARRDCVFLLDAKDHAGSRWPLSQVKPWLAARLDDWCSVDGGQAFVLLRQRVQPVPRVWLIPWAVLSAEWHVAKGAGRTFTPATGWGVETGIDYLPEVLRMHRRYIV